MDIKLSRISPNFQPQVRNEYAQAVGNRPLLSTTQDSLEVSHPGRPPVELANLASGGSAHERLSRAKSELGQVEEQIDRAAGRLDELWQKGDSKFRTQVLTELMSSNALSVETRTLLDEKVARLRDLENQMKGASPAEAARLQEEARRLSEEMEKVLKDSGAGADLLLAVERVIGEAVLGGLFKIWGYLMSLIDFLQAQLDEMIVELQEQREEERKQAEIVEKHQQRIAEKSRSELHKSVMEQLAVRERNRLAALEPARKAEIKP